MAIQLYIQPTFEKSDYKIPVIAQKQKTWSLIQFNA